MYTILMNEGRLLDQVYAKFKELEQSRKHIYVVNSFPTEFNELFHQIPRNARILWEEKTQQSHQAQLIGMTGGLAQQSTVLGTLEGHQYNVYGNYFNVNTGKNYEISSTAIKDIKKGPAITIGKGIPSTSHNQLVVTINHGESNAENDKIYDQVSMNKDKLMLDHVQVVETEKGSVIIKLKVEKYHIMTDRWIQSILKSIFYEILAEFFTETTKFAVTVERHVNISEEEILKLYTTHQDHDECIPKSEYDALKEELDATKALIQREKVANEETGRFVKEERDRFVKEESGGVVKEERDRVKEKRDRLFKEERDRFVNKESGGVVKEERGRFVNEERGRFGKEETGVIIKHELDELSKVIGGVREIPFEKPTASIKAEHEKDKKQMEIDALKSEVCDLKEELTWLKQGSLKPTKYMAQDDLSQRKKAKPLQDFEDAVMYPEKIALLREAHVSGWQQILQDLITSGSININHRNQKGMTLVMTAALEGEKDLFDILVRNGCRLSNQLENGDNILHIACLGGNVEIVEYLLDYDIVDIESPGMYGRTPLMKAAGAGQKEVFDSLVKYGCNINCVGTDHNRLIHVACMSDNEAIVDFILSNGLSHIESRGKFGRTPVMIAASLGRQRVFEYLVKHGCDLTASGSDGNNLLHVACMSDAVDIVHYLVSKVGMDIESKGLFRKTPVMIAAGCGNQRVFDLLVRKGADLLVEDSFGNNILHAAAQGGNLHIVLDILLEVQVDPDSNNMLGQSAYRLALTRFCEQIPLR